MKRCTSCGEVKNEQEFHKRAASPDGLRPSCKSCRKIINANNYQANREAVIKQVQKYVANNRDRYNAYRRGLQKRKMDDPVYRLSRIIRCRTNHVLRGRQKTGASVDYLGCTFDELKVHIEKQFVSGMTWENYGTVWHIDHKEALATLPRDATDEQIRKLAHYTNLRPLWAKENMSLGGQLRHRKIS